MLLFSTSRGGLLFNMGVFEGETDGIMFVMFFSVSSWDTICDGVFDLVFESDFGCFDDNFELLGVTCCCSAGVNDSVGELKCDLAKLVLTFSLSEAGIW